MVVHLEVDGLEARFEDVSQATTLLLDRRTRVQDHLGREETKKEVKLE
jgi:hypothetical protein